MYVSSFLIQKFKRYKIPLLIIFNQDIQKTKKKINKIADSINNKRLRVSSLKIQDILKMDIDNLSPQQLQKAFRLCDIMSLQDIYVAATILQNYGWEVQKAVDEIVYSKEQEHKKQEEKLIPPQNPPQQQPAQQAHNMPIPDEFNYEDDDPYMLHDPQNQQQLIDYHDYEYQYADKDLQNKRKMFEENYVSELPLTKTVSQNLIPSDKLEKDKLLAQDYHRHRHFYQTNLIKKSEQLYQRIFDKQSKQKNATFQNNNSKINLNKKFIVYLHKVYKSKINFTFGTFFLNLIRSYLDDKYLFVFILHEDSTKNGQKVTEKILNQPQFAQFVNSNCISYGMFDNSDDYQNVQKYVPLKQLPAFAVFKYNKKERKQQFIASYPLLSNENQNCLEWLAKSIDIKLKKKQNQKSSIQHIQHENKAEYESISQILKQQNYQYQEIEKLYQMKRLQSRLNKEKIKEKENQIIQLRKYYESNPEPEFVPGKSIQIKFRMPISGESKLRVFRLDQKVQSMFNYIEAMFQNEFQEPFCEFDLTQTFPTLSLKDKKESLIKQIFEDSDRENLIVKEI